ncbi:hypothetical protein AN639_02460 [Candidatus Epulonipiscium fishelsonii]|uniref:Uncharacterized protein n=1 Tax=Candidatus Epulonipiscium fishelsonii TaxID=77094 RepID=A0ACC8XB59_9FIRM|nr:hypothetical protein AN396_07700 [Epulopiscium sp. SCG-B11WGA-EpuloA1]ONI41990.1 hypothetical protein AN639_02460 [Epulopiscium sp. SCG-B05WGA-EpuloA1]
MMQFDERDTIFNRMGLVEDSKTYKEFYERRPDLKEIDDNFRANAYRIISKKMNIPEKILRKLKKLQKLEKILRKIPYVKNMQSGGVPAFKTGNKEIDKIRNQISQTLIKQAGDMRKKSIKLDIAPVKQNIHINIITQQIKDLAKYYGADLVGVAKLEKKHYYSHSSSFGDKKDGEVVIPKYKYGIVIAQELDKDCINRAPHGEQVLATMKGYAESMDIGSKLVIHIKSLGYEAQTDDFFGYITPTMPIAVDAGIGQMGRSNMVVTKEFGNRLKMGVVLTNLELIPDGRIDFGLTEFCKRCRICSRNCPSKSICSNNEPQILEGEIVWPHNEVTCMEMWMKVGTDCGICMSSCPFSQGVDPTLIEKMKDNPEIMDQILATHKDKYGRRNYIKTSLPMVQFNK